MSRSRFIFAKNTPPVYQALGAKVQEEKTCQTFPIQVCYCLMIFSFQSLQAPIDFALYDTDQNQKAHKTIHQEPRKTNLFREMTDFLVEHQVAFSDLDSVYFVHGPGSFTSARVACLLANTLADEYGIDLFPLAPEQYASGIFDPFLKPLSFVQPVFSSTMRIG